LPVLVAGAWLRADAIDSGFLADDYLHYAMLHGAYPLQRAPWDLFRFADGTPEATKRLVNFGFYPWWSHPQFKLSMLRPLPSLLHAFDYRVFGTDARLHHLHSLLWWVLMVIAVAGLFWSALPKAPAAVALLLFALDDSHTAPLFWVCNRSTLITTSFAASALWAHLEWRRGCAWARPLSILLFALALTGGEYALSMFGYLLCFEWLSRLERPSAPRAFLPGVGLALLFLGVAVSLGYGAAHSGVYTNPLTSPLAYLQRLTSGVPVFAGDLFWGRPADLWIFDRGAAARAHQVMLGRYALACACLLCLWLARREDRTVWREVRWFAAGSVLALVPMVGSFLTSRLVLPASIGVCAVLGSVIVLAAKIVWQGVWRYKPFAVALIVALLYVDGFKAIENGRRALRVYRHGALSLTAWPLYAEIDDGNVQAQRIVMPASSDPEATAFLPFARFAYGHPMPKSFWLLSGARSAHEMRRIDDNTLELEVLGRDEELDDSMVGSHTRSRESPLHVGDRVQLAGLSIEVLALERAQPVRMRYRFDRPLEDSSLLFLDSTPVGLRRLLLPRPGYSITLPAQSYPDIDRVEPPVEAPEAVIGHNAP
jgi:hypothetical protein